MRALQRAWLRRGPMACVLWPLSLLYRLVAGANRLAFASGLRHVTRLPVPVVVVGNVIAGGAGKTPVVIALVRHLTRQGLQVGIVSRGYGRRQAGCFEVGPHDEARRVGDEPLLVQRETGVPVFVAARRVEAAQALLLAYPGTQVIVSDDGLQHHALARDIEICVFDARGTGNGWLLPAGPLREPWPRKVDLVLRPEDAHGIAGHTVWRTLASHAVRADGTRAPLGSLGGHKLHALAGIANPQPFFDMLRGAGLHLERTFALPDHHAFEDGSKLDPGATLLCTEKDAVKLWRLRPDAWAVPLQLEIEPAFWEELDRRLDRKLSSAHGSPTP
ncbi:tetraacyldisaccharide 4'-kinase [Ramlibacter sp. XY19]|uniref:tetraacyldisaccharide 4'-kinase n=1 Tax=Ramlibacter paludis TaxID=2908000 RepID=UPI0023DB0945|nr:tetraacyldisaccharide 4'-kinase [Ramlibacter paludis]MCG2593379.1 tetraacyldisaccharide 4'-kinase [Ramlibacter paludis]